MEGEGLGEEVEAELIAMLSDSDLAAIAAQVQP